MLWIIRQTFVPASTRPLPVDRSLDEVTPDGVAVDVVDCRQHGLGTIQVPVTKNGQPRTVPLSTGAVQALREVPRADSPEVFSITWMALHRAFRVGCRAAGIEDLRFHDLRHTATSRMAGRLPNLIELSAVTGHKTMQMLKRYYHPNASELALKLG